MTFVVAPDAVLRRASHRRKHARYVVDAGEAGRSREAAPEPDGLPDREEMRSRFAADWMGLALKTICSCHDSFGPLF